MAVKLTVPIIALDVSSTSEALAVVDRVGDGCDFYKVGGQLFAAEGPDAVRALRSLGKRVFVDLKLHDIPSTVSRGVRELARLEATLVTVHASGGREMLHAAVDAAGPACSVLAVTVLTSLDATALGAAWGRSSIDVQDEVLRLAAIAAGEGAHGIVCSGHEVARVRSVFGGRLATLVPGIRFPGGAMHDQSRVISPREAATLEATYIVVGRAVTGAPDPREAMMQVVLDLSTASLGV
jgi:orotidine-5'-phosphate decarboxylase